jgi:hypothetical protein
LGIVLVANRHTQLRSRPDRHVDPSGARKVWRLNGYVLLASIMQRAVTAKILGHLGLPTEPPEQRRPALHHRPKRGSISLLEARGRLEQPTVAGSYER